MLGQRVEIQVRMELKIFNALHSFIEYPLKIPCHKTFMKTSQRKKRPVETSAIPLSATLLFK